MASKPAWAGELLAGNLLSMSDFGDTWRLSRGRFLDEVTGLQAEQLNWRMYSGALTIGEMALHVAGVEVSFASQLLSLELSEEDGRLKQAATQGVVNDSPFPFSPVEIDPQLVLTSLERSADLLRPIMDGETDDVRGVVIKSALGPIITGAGAMQRLCFHPAYHQGQAYQIKSAPGFPS